MSAAIEWSRGGEHVSDLNMIVEHAILAFLSQKARQESDQRSSGKGKGGKAPSASKGVSAEAAALRESVSAEHQEASASFVETITILRRAFREGDAHMLKPLFDHLNQCMAQGTDCTAMFLGGAGHETVYGHLAKLTEDEPGLRKAIDRLLPASRAQSPHSRFAPLVFPSFPRFERRKATLLGGGP